MISSLLLASGGLILLALCGDQLVSAALTLARHTGLSTLLTGMLIIGFGTSLPEILLALQAVLGGHPGIAHGNIIGSNIANILLILGIASLIAPLPTQIPGLATPMLALLLATALWIAFTSLFGLDVWIGLIFVCLLLAQFFLKPLPQPGDTSSERVRTTHPWQDSIKILLCLAGLPLGAHMLIEGGSDIARYLGIKESVIGLTAIAIGTSLPELAAAISAAIRKETGLIIGNVLGSNLFNILAGGGAIAFTGHQVLAPELLRIAHPVMAASTLLTALFVINGLTIGKKTALLFLSAYAAYITLVALLF